MLLLVTDTSGKHASVALVRADREGKPQLMESSPLAGGTFSAQLVPQIASLLSNHGLSKRNIDAFIVISGPGSFTGLRVGLAAIKALAEILQKPIVPVSVLEVIAVASGKSGKVMAALDAGRGEVYLAEHDPADSKQQALEQLMKVEEMPASAHSSIVFTPDETLLGKFEEQGIASHALERPGAEWIARVGLQRLQAGLTVSPELLEANYIRRSDAEIFAKINS